jgi:hypothetical protein
MQNTGKIFLVERFLPFCEKYFGKRKYSATNALFGGEIFVSKKEKNLLLNHQKTPTITYIMKGCLKAF